MALTAAQICNLGLVRVGQRELVDDLNSDTTQAQICAVLYQAALEELLEVFPWPFATRRATLNQLAGAARTGWGYVYVVPGDCIFSRFIDPGKRNPASDEKIPFELEMADDALGNPTLPVLLCDQAPASLVYTARITTTALFPPLFCTALGWKMAAELAFGLPVKPEVGMRMEAGYEKAWRIAAASQLRQSQSDVKPESSFVRGR